MNTLKGLLKTILSYLIKNNNSGLNKFEFELKLGKPGLELDELISKTSDNSLDDSETSNNSLDYINIFSICFKHLDNGKTIYNKMMKSNLEEIFATFGSNGNGYTYFSLYKKNDNIYLIVVNNQVPINCVKIDNENIFNSF